MSYTTASLLAGGLVVYTSLIVASFLNSRVKQTYLHDLYVYAFRKMPDDSTKFKISKTKPKDQHNNHSASASASADPVYPAPYVSRIPDKFVLKSAKSKSAADGSSLLATHVLFAALPGLIDDYYKVISPLTDWTKAHWNENGQPSDSTELNITDSPIASGFPGGIEAIDQIAALLKTPALKKMYLVARQKTVLLIEFSKSKIMERS